ncbi:M20/M25/M40 family metallo-hydrolase [Luteipulveratus halotolerans]|uniref:Acetylornithine deacetylase n=1 Tax=Luteipulveratus halotolerans TaxID=1631356 RepID=A0A0L6CF38_9MICO|nr:M20/M25/M40 family metallo-hydrolase [Luteipulveratus halotolerans]KNX36123.1 acetylornithine deacetylase [Luteipulveratus halotolerans]
MTIGVQHQQSAARHLSELVRIPTVSTPDPADRDTEAFAEFPRALQSAYPLLHEHLDLTTVGDGGLLFRWQGASDARPLVLMAHWDVVPVEPEQWSDDPFSGRIADGTVHGRGTLDDKGSLVVICEAVESLLAQGFSPSYDVYLSFGCDEEISGTTAPAAVDELRRRGVTPWLVIDEGGAVVEGVFPGLKKPAALVGLAEKGVLDVEIRTSASSGHASMPARHGAVARLAAAITRIDAHPFPVSLTPPFVTMLQTLGPHLAPPLRPLLARADRARPALARLLARLGPETAAVVRTTVAITRLEGSPAANVVASTASAHANIRIQVGETVRTTLDRLTQVVHDPTVELHVVSAADPTPISPSDGPQFAAIRAAVAATYPEAVTAPYVMLQASDARHFHAISEHVYRFSPLAMTRAQRDSIHGVDEHVTIDALGRGVVFYRRLIADHA